MRIYILIALAFIAILGCTGEAKWEPILFSKDTCHHCKMVISDKRFGAEFVTKKGKVYKFDSIECMGHFHEDNKNLEGIAYVVDSFASSKLVDFKKAHIFLDPNVRSPMGKGFFASESMTSLEEHNTAKLPVINWIDVLRQIGRPEFATSL